MKELKEGDLIICFNKDNDFESVGYIRAIWGLGKILYKILDNLNE